MRQHKEYLDRYSEAYRKGINLPPGDEKYRIQDLCEEIRTLLIKAEVLIEKRRPPDRIYARIDRIFDRIPH